jgi:hypothetical protein
MDWLDYRPVARISLMNQHTCRRSGERRRCPGLQSELNRHEAAGSSATRLSLALNRSRLGAEFIPASQTTF